MVGPDGGRSPTEDAALVRRLLAREEDAFVEVLRAWSPGMLRVASAILHDRALADDVLQNTWIAVIEHLDGFEGRSSLRTWVFRILVNTADRRARREGRTVPMGAPAEEGTTVDPDRFAPPGHEWAGHWASVPPPFPTPEEASLSGELVERLEAALATLPERQRVVVTLRDVLGYSSGEVCIILTISAANQRVSPAPRTSPCSPPRWPR